MVQRILIFPMSTCPLSRAMQMASEVHHQITLLLENDTVFSEACVQSEEDHLLQGCTNGVRLVKAAIAKARHCTSIGIGIALAASTPRAMIDKLFNIHADTIDAIFVEAETSSRTDFKGLFNDKCSIV